MKVKRSTILSGYMQQPLDLNTTINDCSFRIVFLHAEEVEDIGEHEFKVFVKDVILE